MSVSRQTTTSNEPKKEINWLGSQLIVPAKVNELQSAKKWAETNPYGYDSDGGVRTYEEYIEDVITGELGEILTARGLEYVLGDTVDTVSENKTVSGDLILNDDTTIEVKTTQGWRRNTSTAYFRNPAGKNPDVLICATLRRASKVPGEYVLMITHADEYQKAHEKSEKYRRGAHEKRKVQKTELQSFSEWLNNL